MSIAFANKQLADKANKPIVAFPSYIWLWNTISK
jgi:hypothetical protein